MTIQKASKNDSTIHLSRFTTRLFITIIGVSIVGLLRHWGGQSHRQLLIVGCRHHGSFPQSYLTCDPKGEVYRKQDLNRIFRLGSRCQRLGRLSGRYGSKDRRLVEMLVPSRLEDQGIVAHPGGPDDSSVL